MVFPHQSKDFYVLIGAEKPTLKYVFLSSEGSTKRNFQIFPNGQDTLKEVRKGAQEGDRQEEPQEAHGILFFLHLQGSQAGAP